MSRIFQYASISGCVHETFTFAVEVCRPKKLSKVCFLNSEISEDVHICMTRDMKDLSDTQSLVFLLFGPENVGAHKVRPVHHIRANSRHYFCFHNVNQQSCKTYCPNLSNSNDVSYCCLEMHVYLQPFSVIFASQGCLSHGLLTVCRLRDVTCCHNLHAKDFCLKGSIW